MAKLLPFRSVNEYDIVNQFALEGTGEAGLLVSISAGNMDEQHGWDFTNSPGAQFNRISSFTYDVKTKVRPSLSGEAKNVVLGFTQFNVAIWDENGEKYQYYKQKATENNVILSGKAMPVITKGLLTLTSGAYIGTPAIGSVIRPSNTVAGAVDVVSPALSGLNKDQVFGKVIGTGSKHGGYIMVLFDTNV